MEDCSKGLASISNGRIGRPFSNCGPTTDTCGISDLSELLGKIKQVLAVGGAEQQVIGRKLFHKFDASPLRKLHLFEPPYKEQMLAIYQTISGNKYYDPIMMERTDAADSFDTARCPIPYRFAKSHLVGEFLSCYGHILRTLDVKAGADILEYGPGQGQLSIHLARLGCNVHAIDIEHRFLDSIRRQCAAR